MKFCLLFLTCTNQTEADKITRRLLEKHLIACAKSFPVKSQFLWHEKIDSSSEILLIMESCEEKFEEVESEIMRLHSYDTPVLISVPIGKIAKKTQAWLQNSL